MTNKGNTQIESTKDYDIFKTVLGNRQIHQPHLTRLIKSIERKNMLKQNPIIVNGDMEVIDGQHRLLATQALGLEIYYTVIEEADLTEIQLLNANTRQWLLSDYLESYIQKGYGDYIKIKDFAKDYRISLPIAIMLLADYGGSGMKGDAFKRGRFEIKDYDKAERMASVLSQIRDHSPDRAFAHMYCVRAVRTMIDKVDPKLLTDQLERYQQTITRRMSVADYLREFENVINAGSTGKIIKLV